MTDSANNDFNGSSRFLERRNMRKNKDLRMIFIENSTQGYKEIQSRFKFEHENTERVILPTSYFFLKKKLNNVRGRLYYPFEFDHFEEL